MITIRLVNKNLFGARIIVKSGIEPPTALFRALRDVPVKKLNGNSNEWEIPFSCYQDFFSKRAVKAEDGHQAILGLCRAGLGVDPENRTLTAILMESTEVMAAAKPVPLLETIGLFDGVGEALKELNIRPNCPICGTETINGRCPQPARH